MKHLLFLGLILVSFCTCKPKELPTVMEITEEKVVLKLSHMSTKAEMQSFKDKITSMDFNMDFSGSEFFDNGNLRRLNLRVACPNGTSGATSADGVTLQFKYYGFTYYFKENPVNFQIGHID